MRRTLVVTSLIVTAALLISAAATAIGVYRIERAFPPVGAFVDVNGTRLHYTDQGSGTPIVLVHGASSNLLEFQVSLVPLLARHHRVLVFDRPGFGHSARGDGPWPDPARLADLLLDAAEQLGAPRPLLVGHSWAGAVVMSALVREPQRVAGGVLLAGAVGHWVGEPSIVERLADWPWLNTLFAHTLLVPTGSLFVPAALEVVFAPAPVPAGQAERVAAPLALRPATHLANSEDLDRLPVFLQTESTRYRDIRTPLLAIHGTADTVVPFWNHARRLQPEVPTLEVEQIDGAGHALHHTHAEAVAAAIRAFARRHGR